MLHYITNLWLVILRFSLSFVTEMSVSDFFSLVLPCITRSICLSKFWTSICFAVCIAGSTSICFVCTAGSTSICSVCTAGSTPICFVYTAVPFAQLAPHLFAQLVPHLLASFAQLAVHACRLLPQCLLSHYVHQLTYQ